MLQACLRASRGMVDLPDTEWRCYSDYDSLAGENAAEEPIADYSSVEAIPVERDAAVARAVELAMAKCLESGFGGFAVAHRKVYFRRQSSADCHANLRPADGVTFHVSPKLADANAEANAQLQEIEHREKIANVKECVISMGCGTLSDRQAVYWLEKGSYNPERAVAGLLDAFETFDLNPPSNWISSCDRNCCRPDSATSA